jgi:hypothetical protein
MNAYATIGTNDTNNNNNMNTTALNPAGNDLLQATSGGSLPALEVVAASGDAFPPLKAVVVDALAIIGIVKVCASLLQLSRHIYLRDGVRNSRPTRKIGPLFLRVSLRRLIRLCKLAVNTTRVRSC